MIAAAPESIEVLSYVLGFGTLVGGIGYATGQYLSSRRKGVADSLKTALDEVDIGKIKNERLSGLLTEKTDELSQVRLENSTLKNTLIGGGAVAPQILEALNKALEDAKAFAHKEHEATRRAIKEAMNDGR